MRAVISCAVCSDGLAVWHVTESGARVRAERCPACGVALAVRVGPSIEASVRAISEAYRETGRQPRAGVISSRDLPALLREVREALIRVGTIFPADPRDPTLDECAAVIGLTRLDVTEV